MTETELENVLRDINAVHWNALRCIVEWWDSLPPNLRQDIEGSGREPAAIVNARKALPYTPFTTPAAALRPDLAVPQSPNTEEMENYRMALAYISKQSSDPQSRELAETSLSPVFRKMEGGTVLGATPVRPIFEGR